MAEIQRMINQLGKEIKNLVETSIELSWYGRGAWSYNDVLLMSAGERDIAMEFINKRLQSEMKKIHPVY